LVFAPKITGFEEPDKQAAASREEGLFHRRRPEIYAPRIRPGRIAEIRISVEDVE
jgi:hypothetical protein